MGLATSEERVTAGVYGGALPLRQQNQEMAADSGRQLDALRRG
jgi:hypothetical protein